MAKKILFISALDFKEKSIQVIKKTPDAYCKNGWEVYYIVARDNSKYGNYFYENEINIPGINIKRIYWPLTNLYDFFYKKNRILALIINKIRSYYVILYLAFLGFRTLKEEADIDVVYGYEIHGVLALKVLKIFGQLKNKLIVTRFQGSFIKEIFQKKQWARALWNYDAISALRFPANLVIMTDDGTNGDKALEVVKSKNVNKVLFLANGVDDINLDVYPVGECNDKNVFVVLTVCRLVKWKRVDRGIEIIKKIVKDYGFNKINYYIVGDGDEKDRLESMVKNYGLSENIIFTGSLPYEEIWKYYNLADAVILTYDHSNVGNPLLEAIRTNKFIFTLNNGDTGSWIKHKFNGFIYNIDEYLIDNMAKDLYELINNVSEFDFIKKNLRDTEKEKLWTWEERLKIEIDEVEKILEKHSL